MALRLRPVREIVAEIQGYFDAHPHTTVELAKKLGIDQSTASRIMRGNFKRVTRSVKNLCKYADIYLYSQAPGDAATRKLLIAAVDDTWDGSPEHGRALAHILRTLKQLRAK